MAGRKNFKFLKSQDRWSYLFGLILLVVVAGMFIPSRTPARPVAAQTSLSGQPCPDQPQALNCWVKYYQGLVDSKDPLAALTDAKARYNTSTFVRTDCHSLAHVIGREAYKKYGSITKAYEAGNDFCASGYYHGVLESVVAAKGKTYILSHINDICQPLAQKKPYGLAHYNCVHGLGHGLMETENDQLFTALSDCDLLNGQWQQQSCYSGVFMQNILGDTSPDDKTNYLKSDDPLYPCTAVAAKYKSMCYFLQTDHALVVEKADFAKVFSLCASLDDPKYQTMCYQSLGRDASSYAAYDISKTYQNCTQTSSPTAQKYCVVGATNDFAYHFQSIPKAEGLCRAITQEEVRTACFQTAENYANLQS